MKSYVVPAVVALAALALAGYGYYHTPAAETQTATATLVTPVTVAKLASGTKASVSIRANYVIRSASDLRTLWQMIPDAGTMPDIDFTKYDVLAIFAGEKPTTGSTIAAQSVSDSDKRLVQVVITSPDVTCVLPKSPTSPYEIVQVPHSDLPLTHTDTAASVGCLPQ